MAFTKIVGAGIHTLSNVHTHNINSSGIITATNFVGPFDGTTGDFSGNVTIGGNLVVNGTTTTLDTNLIDVDKIEVTTAGTNVAVAVTHNGSGDLIRLYEGSTQRVTIDDEGNIGVGAGAVTPHAPLHIRTGTTGAITTLLKLHGPFTSNTGSEGTAIDFGTAADTSIGARIIGTREAAGAKGALRFCTGRENDAGFNDGQMVIDETGTVGIGSATPLNTMALDVVGSIRYSAAMRGATGSSSTPSYAFYADHDTGMYRGNGINILSFATGGTERFFVDSAGNVTFNGGTSVSGIASVHNTLQFTTTGGAHIDHVTNGQNLNFRVSKSSTTDTTMVQINAAAEQTKFRKIITVGLQGGGDTTQIGGGSGIGAYIQLNYANNNIVNTKLLGNNTSWLNSHYGNLGIGTQTADEKFQVRTGTNKFISFTDAQHGSLGTLGSAIIFSRPQDGAKKICGIFQHTNQSLAIAARDDLTFHTGGNAFYYSGSERFRIAADGTSSFYSPAEAWHEGPAVLEASNGYGAIFFRSTGSTHGTSITGTWSIGKLAGTDGFAVLKNGMTGGSGIRQDAPFRISNAGDTTIGFKLGVGVAPETILHVKGNYGDMLRLDRNNTGAVGNQIAFRHSNSGTLTETGSINCVSTANADTGELRFYTKLSGGSNTQHVGLGTMGQLGIGTGFNPASNAKKLTMICDSVGDGIWIGNKESLYPSQSTGYSDLRFTFRDYLTGGYTRGGESIIRAYSESAYATQRRTALIFMNSDNVGAGGTAYEKMRLSSYGHLSFAGDTDTYIHHPEDNEIAITCSGGSIPLLRVGTGGNNATVGIKTDSNLVTNGEAFSVRGYSSFKSLNDGYAAIYTHNEEQSNNTIASHILLNWNGANRAGFGVDADNATMIMSNQNSISFRTGATQLAGTERMLIKNSGGVGINTSLIRNDRFLNIAAPSQDYSNSSTELMDGGGICLQHTDSLASTNRTYPGIFWSGNTASLGRARAGILGVTASNNDATDIVFLTRYAANGTGFYPSDERMRITKDGKIGIKTNNPIGTLDVYDGTFVLSKPNASGGERNWRFVNNNVSAGNLGLQVSTAAGGSTFSNLIEITRGGRVGIKNTLSNTFDSNSNTLCIGDGGGAVGLTFYTAASADGSHISFTESTGSTSEGMISYYQGSYSSTNDRDAMVFKANSSERFRITKHGVTQFRGGYTNSTNSTSTWITLFTFSDGNTNGFSMVCAVAENSYTTMYRVAGSPYWSSSYFTSDYAGDSQHNHSSDITFRILNDSGTKKLQFKAVNYTTTRQLTVISVWLKNGYAIWA